MELHILISASATGSPDYESAVRVAGGIPHAGSRAAGRHPL